MRTATIRRPSLAVALAVVGVAAPSGALLFSGAALARPINDLGGPKDCKLGGTTIRSGSRGRSGGIEYECTNGIACQVENGRTTRKCSHASRLGVVRGPHGLQLLVRAPRG
jgi:hypothetical protein